MIGCGLSLGVAQVSSSQLESLKLLLVESASVFLRMGPVNKKEVPLAKVGGLVRRGPGYILYPFLCMDLMLSFCRGKFFLYYVDTHICAVLDGCQR